MSLISFRSMDRRLLGRRLLPFGLPRARRNSGCSAASFTPISAHIVTHASAGPVAYSTPTRLHNAMRRSCPTSFILYVGFSRRHGLAVTQNQSCAIQRNHTFRSGFAQEVCPGGHELPALLESVTSPISPFDCIADKMSQCSL